MSHTRKCLSEAWTMQWSLAGKPNFTCVSAVSLLYSVRTFKPPLLSYSFSCCSVYFSFVFPSLFHHCLTQSYCFSSIKPFSLSGPECWDMIFEHGLSEQKIQRKGRKRKGREDKLHWPVRNSSFFAPLLYYLHLLRFPTSPSFSHMQA